MPDRISAFVEAVGAEIRWKKARPLLTEEIRTHLLDQRDACMAQGMAEDEAQAEAVRQMGDPVALGADLDRVHRPRPQWGLLALALMLAAAGAFLRFSLTADVPYVSLQDRQMDLLGGLLGAAALAAGYLLDVSTLGRRAWLACTALAAAFLCFLPWTVNGPAWLSAQLLSLFALTLALVLWKQRGRRWRGAAVCLSWTALAAAACCLCPKRLRSGAGDNGGAGVGPVLRLAGLAGPGPVEIRGPGAGAGTGGAGLDHRGPVGASAI